MWSCDGGECTHLFLHAVLDIYNRRYYVWPSPFGFPLSVKRVIARKPFDFWIFDSILFLKWNVVSKFSTISLPTNERNDLSRKLKFIKAWGYFSDVKVSWIWPSTASDDETPVQECWRMGSKPSLSLLSCSLWTRVLVWVPSPMVQETGVQSKVESYQRLKKWH